MKNMISTIWLAFCAVWIIALIWSGFTSHFYYAGDEYHKVRTEDSFYRIVEDEYTGKYHIDEKKTTFWSNAIQPWTMVHKFDSKIDLTYSTGLDTIEEAEKRIASRIETHEELIVKRNTKAKVVNRK